MKEQYVRRYTDLFKVFNYLETQTLEFSNPSTWQDKNDAHSVEQFRKKMNFESVFALCFARETVAYHYWQLFTTGPYGICLIFHRNLVEEAAGKLRLQNWDVFHNDVEYVPAKSKKPFGVYDLPFLKREGYYAEDEYRVVAATREKRSLTPKFHLPLTCLHKIILNPFIRPDDEKWVKQAIRSKLAGKTASLVLKSALVSSKNWRGFIDSIN